MDYLAQLGYTTISVKQYESWLGGADLRKGQAVLLTFDDGATSQPLADPILKRHGFRALAFLVTGFADGSNRYWLSWSDVRALRASGRWDFGFYAGPHGHTRLPDGCPYYMCELEGETSADHRRRVISEDSAFAR
jgi:peptidoglycan/xylan/chitin deacetylase (PgdA/CDA1 family)